MLLFPEFVGTFYYLNLYAKLWFLTLWGQVTHICVGKPIIIGSDNGLSPDRRQAIIWTNAEILLIRPLGRNFSEILIGIQTFSFKKMYLKMLSAKWRPFCLGLNVLRLWFTVVLCCQVWTCWGQQPVCQLDFESLGAVLIWGCPAKRALLAGYHRIFNKTCYHKISWSLKSLRLLV